MCRCKSSFLAQFARDEHEIRVQKCDDYFNASEEYFFERSAHLFETVYKFYATGCLHRPLDVCLQVREGAINEA